MTLIPDFALHYPICAVMTGLFREHLFTEGHAFDPGPFDLFYVVDSAFGRICFKHIGVWIRKEEIYAMSDLKPFFK